MFKGDIIQLKKDYIKYFHAHVVEGKARFRIPVTTRLV